MGFLPCPHRGAPMGALPWVPKAGQHLTLPHPGGSRAAPAPELGTEPAEAPPLPA